MLSLFRAPWQAPADSADKKEEKLLKPVPKPDENELKEKIEETNEKVAKLQVRALPALSRHARRFSRLLTASLSMLFRALRRGSRRSRRRSRRARRAAATLRRSASRRPI